MHAHRRATRRGWSARGFTLVELMVVVVIVGTVIGFAVGLFARGGRADAAAAFSRSAVMLVHETRQAAMANNQSWRLRVIPATATTRAQIWSQLFQVTSATAGNWITDRKTPLPSGLELCQPVKTANATSAPTCPANATVHICFAPSGRVFLVDGSSDCPGILPGTSTPVLGDGAMLYLRGATGNSNAQKYRLWIRSLTGLPQLIDRWP